MLRLKSSLAAGRVWAGGGGGGGCAAGAGARTGDPGRGRRRAERDPQAPLPASGEDLTQAAARQVLLGPVVVFYLHANANMKRFKKYTRYLNVS